MRTLPREPWRGGQICGWQMEYGVVGARMVFCGEYKKQGSPLCDEHDRDLREDNYGVLPRFAPGNALGLAAYRRETMPYMFRLSWEPKDTPEDPHGETPVPATDEEIRAWEESDT